MMTTVHRTQDGHYIQFTKGAPDEILKRCSTVLEGGAAVPLTDAGRERILAANKGMADRALRVLAVAQKQLAAPPPCTNPMPWNVICASLGWSA